MDANLGIPSMCIDTQIAGLRAGIAAALTYEQDVKDPVKSNWQF